MKKLVKNRLKDKGPSYKIPQLERILEIYELIAVGGAKKEIKPITYKKLGVAILFYAAEMPEYERKDFMKQNEIPGFYKNDIEDIEFALEDCMEIKKSWRGKTIQVTRNRNVLSSLLSLLIHMDDLGTREYSLYRTIENFVREKRLLDMYGSIPAKELESYLNEGKLRDSWEERLIEDESVAAFAILGVLRTPYYVAPIKDSLNNMVLREIDARKEALKTETLKIIKEKEKNEESLSP